jgi:hypothetical protein
MSMLILNVSKLPNLTNTVMTPIGNWNTSNWKWDNWKNLPASGWKCSCGFCDKN